MKNGIIAAVVVVVLVVVGYFSYTKFMVKPFGYETIAKMDKGNYKIACGDAKKLIVMMNDINKNFAENPSMEDKASEETMTSAMKKFETSMDNFGNAIEKKFSTDNETKEKVFSGIGEDVSQIFQVAAFNRLGMITQENVEDFIDVTFCNAKPKEGYISPLDINPSEIKIPGNMGDDIIEEEGIDEAPENGVIIEKGQDEAPQGKN